MKAIAIFDRVGDSMAWLACVFIILIMLAVSIDVILRYFIGGAIVGVLEISEYILLYLTFLGTTWLLKREGHVIIDFLVTQLKPKNQAWLLIVTSIIGAVLTLTLTWYGVLVTLDAFHRDVCAIGVLRLPVAPVIAIIPIGSFLLCIQFLRRAYGGLKRVSPSKERDAEETQI